MPLDKLTLAQILEQQDEEREKEREELLAIAEEFEEGEDNKTIEVLEKVIAKMPEQKQKTAKDEIAELKAEGKSKEEIKEAMEFLINEIYGT